MWRLDSQQNKCLGWFMPLWCFYCASYIIIHKAHRPLVVHAAVFHGWQYAAAAVTVAVKLPLQSRNKNEHAKVLFSGLMHSLYNSLGERLNKNATEIPPFSLLPQSSSVYTWVSPQQACAVHSPFWVCSAGKQRETLLWHYLSSVSRGAHTTPEEANTATFWTKISCQKPSGQDG